MQLAYLCRSLDLLSKYYVEMIQDSQFWELMKLHVIVRLLVATLHVGMTQKQDGGYTQSTQLQWDYIRWVKISFTHQ